VVIIILTFGDEHGKTTMKELENSLSQLVENSDIRMLSPVTRERLKAKGIQLAKPPQRTLEESIDLLFSDKRKEIALEVAKKLPVPPDMAAPSIKSLYDEIRLAIILGLNGAAITLSGVLVEHALKYATYKVEIGGFANYDPAKTDEFESFTLGPAISRAAKAGLLDQGQIDGLKLFKDKYRNPYNHYNIKKITEGCHGDMTSLNIETNQAETSHIWAKDNPVVQAQIKPYVDAASVFEVFTFVDSVVKYLWGKINIPQNDTSSTEA
jgi:hypothetical protein